MTRSALVEEAHSLGTNEIDTAEKYLYSPLDGSGLSGGSAGNTGNNDAARLGDRSSDDNAGGNRPTSDQDDKRANAVAKTKKDTNVPNEDFRERVLRHYGRIESEKRGPTSHSTGIAKPPPQLVAALRKVYRDETKAKQHLPALLRSVMDHVVFSGDTDGGGMSLSSSLRLLSGQTLQKQTEQNDRGDTVGSGQSTAANAGGAGVQHTEANLEVIIGNLCSGLDEGDESIQGSLVAILSVLCVSILGSVSPSTSAADGNDDTERQNRHQPDEVDEDEPSTTSTEAMEEKAKARSPAQETTSSFSAETIENGAPLLQVGAVLSLLSVSGQTQDGPFRLDEDLLDYFSKAASTYEERIVIQKAHLLDKMQAEAVKAKDAMETGTKGKDLSLTTPGPATATSVAGAPGSAEGSTDRIPIVPITPASGGVAAIVENEGGIDTANTVSTDPNVSGITDMGATPSGTTTTPGSSGNTEGRDIHLPNARSAITGAGFTDLVRDILQNEEAVRDGNRDNNNNNNNDDDPNPDGNDAEVSVSRERDVADDGVGSIGDMSIMSDSTFSGPGGDNTDNANGIETANDTDNNADGGGRTTTNTTGDNDDDDDEEVNDDEDDDSSSEMSVISDGHRFMTGNGESDDEDDEEEDDEDIAQRNMGGDEDDSMLREVLARSLTDQRSNTNEENANSTGNANVNTTNDDPELSFDQDSSHRGSKNIMDFMNALDTSRTDETDDMPLPKMPEPPSQYPYAPDVAFEGSADSKSDYLDASCMSKFASVPSPNVVIHLFRHLMTTLIDQTPQRIHEAGKTNVAGETAQNTQSVSATSSTAIETVKQTASEKSVVPGGMGSALFVSPSQIAAMAGKDESKPRNTAHGDTVSIQLFVALILLLVDQRSDAIEGLRKAIAAEQRAANGETPPDQQAGTASVDDDGTPLSDDEVDDPALAFAMNYAEDLSMARHPSVSESLEAKGLARKAAAAAHEVALHLKSLRRKKDAWRDRVKFLSHCTLESLRSLRSYLQSTVAEWLADKSSLSRTQVPFDDDTVPAAVTAKFGEILAYLQAPDDSLLELVDADADNAQVEVEDLFLPVALFKESMLTSAECCPILHPTVSSRVSLVQNLVSIVLERSNETEADIPPLLEQTAIPRSESDLATYQLVLLLKAFGQRYVGRVLSEPCVFQSGSHHYTRRRQ